MRAPNGIYGVSRGVALESVTVEGVEHDHAMTSEVTTALDGEPMFTSCTSTG
jgi:hypothetical protein